MKTKVLAISQVLIDKETYPRMGIDFVTIARYSYAMKSGAEFPPICVGFLDGKYYLIDGRHRIEAKKVLKEAHLSAEVLKVKDKEEIYLEAIKRNIAHGRQFSTQEVTNVMITLENWGLSDKDISEVVRIPAETIKPFIAKRMVRVLNADNTESSVALKSSLKHLAGTTQTIELVGEQEKLTATARGQFSIINTVIYMIENNLIDFDTPLIARKVQHLSNLLQSVSIPKPVRKKRTKKAKKAKASSK